MTGSELTAHQASGYTRKGPRPGVREIHTTVSEGRIAITDGVNNPPDHLPDDYVDLRIGVTDEETKTFVQCSIDRQELIDALEDLE